MTRSLGLARTRLRDARIRASEPDPTVAVPRVAGSLGIWNRGAPTVVHRALAERTRMSAAAR